MYKKSNRNEKFKVVKSFTDEWKRKKVDKRILL